MSIVKRKNCATLTRIFVCVRIAQYLKNITAESVAESFFVSKWYVNNICKRFYNKSFRQTIIDTVSCQGGHLASNLGDVELTIALHRAFSSPHDKLIFDVTEDDLIKMLEAKSDEAADYLLSKLEDFLIGISK